MSTYFPSPITTGIGGPLAALFTGLSGYSKTLPWYFLCPIYCFIAAPLILLLPITLPLYILHVLAKHYRTTHTKKGAFASVLNQNGQGSTKADADASQAAQASRTEGDASHASISAGGEELSEDMKEAVAVANRTRKIKDELIEEEAERLRNQEYVANALASYNTTAFISKHIKLLALCLLSYYSIFFAVIMGAGFAISNAMMIYVEKAKLTKELQIATPAQMEYANSVNNILTVAGLILVLTVIFIFALIAVSAVKDVLNNTASNGETNQAAAGADAKASAAGANSSGAGGDSSKAAGEMENTTAVGTVRTAFRVLFRNLPGLAVLVCILYAVTMVVERYYAHLRIVAIEAMVLGNSYFDPSISFIALRLYIIYAFSVAFMLVILMSLNALPLLHRSLQTDKNIKRPK